MKTTRTLPSGMDLRAYFVGCALSGYLANSREKPGYDAATVREGQTEHVIDYCVDVGLRVYERYKELVDDDPPDDTLRNFNSRVGV